MEQQSTEWGTIEDITDEEKEELREAFEMFDKNKDGFIDKNELGTVMKSLGSNPTNEELVNMIQKIDIIRKDGKIDFEEFVVFYINKERHNHIGQNELLESFKVLDRSGTGRISKDDLRIVMSKLGECLTDEELDMMINEADTNNNGEIDYEEYVRIITK